MVVVVAVCQVCILVFGIIPWTPPLWMGACACLKCANTPLGHVVYIQTSSSYKTITFITIQQTLYLLALLVSLGLLYIFAEHPVFQASVYKGRKKRKVSNKFVYNSVFLDLCIFCLVWDESVEINPMLFLLLASPETLWCEWLSKHHQIHHLDSKKCYPLLSPTQQMLRFL